jgi:DmsE family decaheme c-type cytochrome
MSCGSCHDVHRANQGALKTVERTNDLCTSCHPAQEGPFIFEHAPVAEDCLTCHQPHGSTANNLLAANEPFLCLQCHELHFHTGFKAEEPATVVVGGKPYPNVMGADGNQKAFGTRCTQCHTAIHGSDLPSQTTTGRGKGLVR